MQDGEPKALTSNKGAMMKLKFDSPHITMKALKLYFTNHKNNRVLVEPSHPSFISNKAIDLGKFSQIYKKTEDDTKKR